MTGTSTPAKRLGSAQSSFEQHASFLSFIVDVHSGSILRVGPVAQVSAGRAAKFATGKAAKTHKLLYELISVDTAPAMPGLVWVEKRQGAGKTSRSTARADSATDVDAGPRPDGVKESLVRTLIEKTLASFKEIQGRHAGELTEDELIREVGQTLADKSSAHSIPVEEGWQELLDRGLRSKVALLSSELFKSTNQASELLGVGEPAVRKRIREQKLFSLKVSGSGEHRIPTWALDPGIAGATTTSLYASVPGLDEWRLYHFLSTPNGNLNGLRPFECLLSSASLTPTLRGARDELISELKPSTNVSLLEIVESELKAEAQDGRYE